MSCYVTGYITPETAFPGYLSLSAGLEPADVPTGLAISEAPPGWTEILLYIAWCDVSRRNGRSALMAMQGMCLGL